MLGLDPNQWIILALIFVLGLLVGVMLTAGGRKKWKTRYHDERGRLAACEQEHKDREAHWANQEKEWRERDSLRAAAVKGSSTLEDDRPL